MLHFHVSLIISHFNWKGYYKNEDATNEMIDSNGWVRSGDLGYYDQDLDFFVIDRLKELIKVKGSQVRNLLI